MDGTCDWLAGWLAGWPFKQTLVNEAFHPTLFQSPVSLLPNLMLTSPLLPTERMFDVRLLRISGATLNYRRWPYEHF